MTDNIDFSVPNWLINYYQIIGFISILLNTLGFYLLLWQNGKMGGVKYYLLVFQVSVQKTSLSSGFKQEDLC